MVKCGKREGIPAVQYTRQFQEKYFRENQGKLDHILEQRFLSHCQDEVFNKLKKCIPEPTQQFEHTREIDDCFLYGGSSLDWFDEWCSTSNSKRPERNLQTVFSWEDSVLKNIEFVESIMRVSSESEKNTPVPASLLHQLLYDEAEYTYQPCQSDSLTFLNTKQFSEDSGIGNSERFSDGSCGFNSVSGNVVKFVLQSSNADQTLLRSVTLLLNYLKSEVKSKPIELFNKWKDSVVEYVTDTLRECSRRNIQCRGMVLSLILDLLGDIWNDERLAQHKQWEAKACIVNELLTCSEICYEILQFISEKVILFLKCSAEKSESVPLIVEKLCLFLNMYCNVCATIKDLKSECLSEDSVNVVNTEETDITSLWQEKWCAKDAEEELGEWDKIADTQIQVLERLIICVTSRYSLMALLAMEALKRCREMNSSNKHSESSCVQ